MNRKPASLAFLMEMLWVCGFFILSACIFVLAFVKADTMSQGARNLNRAVTAAENALEDTFAEYDRRLSVDIEDEDTKIFYFDRDWKLLENSITSTGNMPENTAFFISVSSQLKDSLLEVTAEVSSITGEHIYILDGVHYVPIS